MDNIPDRQTDRQNRGSDEILENLKEVSEDKEGKFRFNNQRALFTYKTHINKEEFTSWIKTSISNKTRKIYIAHENGDTTNDYEHTHVVVDFGKNVDTKNSRYFDYMGIHPHIRIIYVRGADRSQWLRSCKYITKEDISVKLDIEDQLSDTQIIWSHNSLSEALVNVEIKQVTNVIALWNHRPQNIPPPKISREMFYPWQEKMFKTLEGKPDGRSLYWVYGEKGNTGKTRFCEWLCKTYPNRAILLNAIGKVADFCHNIKSFKDAGWNGDIAFVNLSKSYCDRSNIYEACEMLLDGYVTCTKYTGGATWIQDVHVIVFSNFLPQVDKLSKDRWKIYHLKEDDSFDWEYESVEQVNIKLAALRESERII